MTLANFIKLVKRTARYGDINTTSDQVTSDIINYINNRRFEFWRAWLWDWSADEISISTAGDFTLASTVGSVLVLYISGENGYLRPVSLKRYLQWLKNKDESTGTPTHYIKLGRNSSNQLKYRLWRTPESSVTVKGFTKTRLTAYTVSDIAANTGLEFFPEETHDILFHGVLGDVYEAKNEMDLSRIKKAEFTNKIAGLIADEENQADEEIQSEMPDSYIWKKRMRGGTTVV